MISFIAGTYHGLFVDTGAPSILPKDISYFDFRTQRGRVIPSEDSPNLVIRYNSGGEQGDPPMMMVALSYRAIEGKREGFIAFGSLVFEKLAPKNIEDGVRAAIIIAQKSSHIFNGKVISHRPIPGEGRPLDLTGLPLFEGNYFFGELSASFDDNAAISQVSKFAHELITRGIDNYEVVISPLRGMTPDGLMDHFGYLVSRQKSEVEELRERTKRLNDHKRLEASLEAEKAIDQSKRKMFLLQAFALSLVGISTIGLIIILLSKFAFTKEDSVPSQPLLTELSETSVASIPEPDVAEEEDTKIRAREANSTNCGPENLKDTARAKIVTDLPTDGSCIKIEPDVLKLLGIKLGTKPFAEIIVSPDVSFETIDWLPAENQTLLTTFGRLVDIKRTLLEENKSKFYNENQELVLPKGLGLNFGLSMEKPLPRLFCNAGIFRADRPVADSFQYSFYTTSQHEYQKVIEVYSLGVLDRLQAVIKDLENKLEGAVDEEQLKSFARVSRDIRDFTTPQKLPLFDGQWDNEEDMCVVVVTQEDQQSFSNRIDNTKIDDYLMTDFVRPLVELVKKEDVESTAEKDFSIECKEIPGLLMIWKSADNASSLKIMSEVSGFTPFTAADGEYFDYWFKTRKRIPSENRYRLPESKVFAGLVNYFEAEPDFSPFSDTRTNQRGFCLSEWQSRR